MRRQDRRQLVGQALRSPPSTRRRFSACTRSRRAWASRRTYDTASSSVLQLGPQGAQFDQRELPGVHRLSHQHPPLTGGRTATSSPAPTGSVGSAASPFTHTLHDGSTRAKPSPNEAVAAASTSPTVAPANSARPVPAASRADANIRNVAIAASVPGDTVRGRERGCAPSWAGTRRRIGDFADRTAVRGRGDALHEAAKDRRRPTSWATCCASLCRRG